MLVNTNNRLVTDHLHTNRQWSILPHIFRGSIFNLRRVKSFAFFKTLIFTANNVGLDRKKGKRKVQGVPQSQTAALPRPQEEEETDKSKQAQTEQTYEKH